jgi:hypothetical protein
MTTEQAVSNQKEEKQRPENASRRKAVRTIAVGSAIVGAAALIPLGTLSKGLTSDKTGPKPSVKLLSPFSGSLNSDPDVASVAYVNIGQIGTGTVARDENTGAISSINYASPDNSVTASITVGPRNPDGSIQTINVIVTDSNTVSPDPYTANATATVGRNQDGSISKIVWTGTSSGGV